MLYDPDVTTSTSVKVPIVELKYKNAWVAALGNDSRFGNVAVWVIVAVGGRPTGADGLRELEPRERVGDEVVGRRPSVNTPIEGIRVDASYSPLVRGFPQPEDRRKTIPKSVLGECRLARRFSQRSHDERLCQTRSWEISTQPDESRCHLG